MMKQYRTVAIWAVATFTTLLTACEKEVTLPDEVTTNLLPGRAFIQFTISHDFVGSKEFFITNTHTTADRFMALNGRNIVLTATEMNGSLPVRKVLIDIHAVNDRISEIDLSRNWNNPSTSIRLVSFSPLGGFHQSQAGTLIFTKITPAEVEGSFTATFDGGITIKNGRFAGKF